MIKNKLSNNKRRDPEADYTRLVSKHEDTEKEKATTDTEGHADFDEKANRGRKANEFAFALPPGPRGGNQAAGSGNRSGQGGWKSIAPTSIAESKPDQHLNQSNE